MRGFNTGLLVLLSTIALLTACGGNGGPSVQQSAGLPQSDEVLRSTPVEPPGVAGLPQLGALTQPAHKVSLLGPGYELLENTAITNSGNATLNADDSFSLASGTGLSFVVLGAYGFDGDNGPTSARLTVAAASGPFYLGFSDYEHGKWLWSEAITPPAAGGVTEVSIPNTGEFVSPAAFIGAHYAATYLALVAGPGSTCSGAKLELGIHGGTQGPLPPYAVAAGGNAEGLTVRWQASASEDDPDFDGYVVERAPYASGSYERLSVTPEPDCYFDDLTATLGLKYRYRVAAQDHQGNLSLWATGTGISGAMTERPLVVAARMPHGPLFAPADVQIDMSGSFDPEGAAITQYTIVNGGKILYDGAGYLANLTLQPSCYFFDITVHAGAKMGRQRFYLKVYPRWQDGARLIVNSTVQNNTPRMNQFAAARDESDGSFLLAGYDPTIPGLAFRRIKLGQRPQLAVANVSSPPVKCGEPFVQAGSIFYAMQGSGDPLLYSSDGEVVRLAASLNYGMNVTCQDFAACPAPDGEIWFLSGVDDNGVPKLELEAVVGVGVQVPADPAVDDIQCVDMVYNDALQALEIVYGTPSGVQWIRWDTVTESPLDSAQVASVAVPAIDIEINPANGEPAVAYYNAGDITFKQHSTLGWSVGTVIDPSGGNSNSFDLEFGSEGPSLYTSDIGAQASIYSRDGGGIWQPFTVPFAATTYQTGSLCLFDSAGEQRVAIASTGVDRHCTFNIEKDDGNLAGTVDLFPTSGAGYELFAADSTDGLHVVYREALNSTGKHVRSSDAVSWMGAPDLPGTYHLDLSSLTDGTLYLAKTGFVGAVLQRWDGSNFVDEASSASTLAYRGFLNKFPSTSVHWVSYEPGLMNLKVVQGNETDGYVSASDILTDPAVYTGTALMTSPSDQPEFAGTYWVYGGSTLGYDTSSPQQYQGIADPPEQLWGGTRDNAWAFEPEVMGRNLAYAPYADFTDTQASSLGNGLKAALYASSGIVGGPIRYSAYNELQPSLVRLPLGDQASVNGDYRYTVSAAQTDSFTAVGLVNSIAGSDMHLEWSDYGRWEDLPLPPPDSTYASDEYASQAQLLIDRDGRWHIFYRQYDTDTIFVRSSM